eukprot:3932847-Rhodomonas_salina.1
MPGVCRVSSLTHLDLHGNWIENDGMQCVVDTVSACCPGRNSFASSSVPAPFSSAKSHPRSHRCTVLQRWCLWHAISAALDTLPAPQHAGSCSVASWLFLNSGLGLFPRGLRRAQGAAAVGQRRRQRGRA